MIRPALRNRLFAALAAVLAAVPVTANAAGGADISAIFLDLIERFAILWIPVAVLVVVAAGFTLMVSQEDGKVQKAKSTVVAVMIGGIITTIVLVFGPRDLINILYTGIPGTELLNTGEALGMEAEGVAGWLSAMAVMLGILIIVVAVLRAVFSLGEEERYTKVRLAVLHVVIGLVIIAGSYLFRIVFFEDKEPSALIAFIAGRVVVVLSFVSIIAVAILIYAGFRMVISFGREEDFTAAKSLAYRVVVGLMVVALSFALVLAVVAIFNG
jgi:chromate transport protein ChrA